MKHLVKLLSLVALTSSSRTFGFVPGSTFPAVTTNYCGSLSKFHRKVHLEPVSWADKGHFGKFPTTKLWALDNNDDDDTAVSPWFSSLVLPLWLVYISNQWSRYSISYLVDFSKDADPYTAMNVDLDFSKTQYGLLASLAFTSLFAVASLGAGVASDKLNRKTLTVASAACWSAACLATGMADSYTQVVILRVAMGLACAFSTPTAYTLIRERAPDDRVSLASGFYGTGVAVASALASLSILIDSEIGWRNTLIAISLFGFGTAGWNALVLSNDPKTKNDQDEGRAFTDVLSGFEDVVSTSRARWLLLGSFLRFCSGLCIGVWGAPYYRMTFPDQQSQYSLAQAAISAVGASLSGLLGGYAADYLSSQKGGDPVGKRLWVPVVGSLLAAPAWYFAVHSEGSFEVAMAWLAAEYFVAECWFGPTISTLQSTVDSKVGGTAQGLFTLTGAIANLAPSILGFLYGQSSGGMESSQELSNLLAAAVCFGYLSSAFCFGMASQAVPDVKMEEQ